LYIAPQVFEAKHVGLDNPGARGHSVQPERTFLVGESHQASLALSRTDRGAGNRLASGLDRAGLRGNRLCKDEWQARRQKHENFEH